MGEEMKKDFENENHYKNYFKDDFINLKLDDDQKRRYANKESLLFKLNHWCKEAELYVLESDQILDFLLFWFYEKGVLPEKAYKMTKRWKKRQFESCLLSGKELQSNDNEEK